MDQFSLLLLFLFVSSSLSENSKNWHQFGLDASHSRFQNVSFPSTLCGVNSRPSTFSSDTSNQVVVHDGIMYYTEGGNLIASYLNQTTLWKVSHTKTSPVSLIFIDEPVRKLLCGVSSKSSTGDTEIDIFLVNITSGALLWNTNLTGDYHNVNVPVYHRDGYLLLTSSERYVGVKLPDLNSNGPGNVWYYPSITSKDKIKPLGLPLVLSDGTIAVLYDGPDGNGTLSFLSPMGITKTKASRKFPNANLVLATPSNVLALVQERNGRVMFISFCFFFFTCFHYFFYVVC
eukprot:TRINITY_DN318_c0_g1_i1.p1 TRINITY_DN318_c0_g1~~TRINITY_DN318_c0_g1_i1.p1  ORF type:complete len:288 (-),score=42.26 TRINITY_DN318_c0_g1_i1:481-1344(-)